MSEPPLVHADWDAERVVEHMAGLRKEESAAEAIHDYLSEESDSAWREVCRVRDQIAYCESMFSKPKKAAS